MVHPEVVALTNSKPTHWSITSYFSDLPILVMHGLRDSWPGVSSGCVPHSVALIPSPILLNVAECHCNPLPLSFIV
jgi:hypothetical protein